ncbi:N-acetylmuramoyl-L-alanine amidase [Pelagicoccus sp. SDUM812003]|uniref:N-acetylmuramoyl-L-alanine amidase family protein n=1 Tax=Pelagicoccus sp. SDUM812003 TaxID=3041267 RepID=UPI00280E9E3F|nr:N-acetylmuramoyl-L-alanine amidase [Pelagicoccus sp. SDUM812003]MDQ8202018.1 N-acetylmuramoyl-L-alanine amidase [Pelagicoccus sp. SDUM812003]
MAAVASLFLWGCQTTGGDSAKPEDSAPTEETAVETAAPEPKMEVPKEEELASETSAAQPAPSESSLSFGLNSLKRQVSHFGAQVTEPTGNDDLWKVSVGARELVLKEKSRMAWIDGTKVFLDAPFSRRMGQWLLGASDEAIVLPSALADEGGEPREIKTIVIDPGHGGSEPGTRNATLGLLEKDLNLDVSLRLQAHLEEAGFKAVLTRYEDRLVTLEERSEIANGVKADLFVSVHFNAAPNKQANGVETYLLTPQGQPSTGDGKAGDDAVAYPGNEYDLESFELGLRVQINLLERLKREDRGVKKGRFVVLRGLKCPGILVECGFLSHKDEALLISTAGYRERVALSLADAIKSFAANERFQGRIEEQDSNGR